MDNKKINIPKVIKIIIGVALLWALFFSIDYILAQMNMRPIFVVRTAIYKDGGSREYLGLGYKVIKFNTLDGRRDTVMGKWSMNINDLNNTKTIITNAAYELFRVHYFSEEGFPKLKILKDLDELNDEFSNFEDEKIIDNNIIDMINNKYNEQYFKNKTLISLVLQEPSGSISHNLENILLDNDTLYLNIIRNLPEVGTDDLAWWVFLIEVNKDIMTKVNRVEYNIIDVMSLKF